MQPPCRRLISGFDLSDNAGKRAIAQGILGHSKHAAIARALRIEDLVRTKPDLFKARRIKVEPGQRPEGSKVRLAGEASGYAGNEQGGCRIIAERWTSRCNFMQGRPIKATVGQALINRANAEGQGRATRGARLRQLCQKCSKRRGAERIRCGSKAGHGTYRLKCSLYVPAWREIRQAG